MFYCPRFRFVAAIVYTAIACALCASRAHGQDTIVVKSADLPGLIAAAEKAKVAFQYKQNTTTEKSAAQGSGGAANGPDAAKLKVENTTAPTVALPGGQGASGGTGSAAAEAAAGSGSFLSSPWFWLGIFLILAGAALYIIPKVSPTTIPIAIPAKLPAGLVGGGVLCMVAAFTSPFIAMLLVCAGVAVVLFPTILHAVQASKANAASATAAKQDGATIAAQQSALRMAADATAGLPASIQAPVLAAMSKEADTGDHEVFAAAVHPTLAPIKIPTDVPKPA